MVVGITGKIGVGKSSVARLFEKAGWIIIDADEIGKYVVTHNPKLLTQLEKKFGSDVLINKKILRRELLRERAFKNKQSTNALNKIVHPFLLPELFRQLDAHKKKNKNIVIDAALLLDWKLDKKIDKVILVHTNKKLRLKRMLKRGFSQEEVIDIDNRQKSFKQLRQRSDYLIYNSGSQKELQEKIKRLLVKLQK